MKKQRYAWFNNGIVLSSLIAISLAVRIPPQPRTQIFRSDDLTDVIQPKLDESDVALKYDLAKSTRPKHYKISLTPYLTDPKDKKYLTFDGIVEITLTPQYNTKIIELNANTLTIDVKKTTLKTEKDPAKPGTLVDVEIAKQTDSQKDLEKFIVETKNDLEISKEYILSITYTGKMDHEDLKGFYKSTYEVDGKTIVIGTTQFESSGARRAFPCYDELGIKATYQVIITAHKSLDTVISNTDIEDTKTDKDLITTTFKKTPVPMSTYLLAFVVSDFKSTSSKTPKMAVFSQEKFLKFADRSLQFGIKAIEEINTFLGGDVSYFNYMEKLDQVGIPDFAAGAMENWGLVTYRELQFLFDENTATSWAKQKIYLTIAHEFAHQWFGNLVTPTWWSYIWLNEGFATYIEYMSAQEAVKKLEKPYKEEDWRLVEHFALHERQNAFLSDALSTIPPMTHHVESPEAVNNLFTSTIYAKAASVLYMLEHILTKSVFQQGLNAYLKTNAKSTVTPDKLWEALQSAHDQHSLEKPDVASELGRLRVHDIGNSWSLQAGYPIVTVTKEENIVKLEQKRFLTDTENITDTVFIVPITYVLQSKLKEDATKTQPEHFLTSRSRTIQVTSKTDFILVNNLQSGYYRVNYDTENWHKIIAFIEKSENLKQIPAVTLSQIIDDSLTFSRVGVLPYNYTLKVAELLKHVDDYVPWYAAENNFKTLDSQLAGSDAELNYLEYQKSLLETVYAKIQKEIAENKGTHLDKLSTLLLLKRACIANVGDCRNATREELLTNIENNKSIKPDKQLGIYCGGSREADEELYKTLLDHYRSDTLKKYPGEKTNLILGMGCMDDKKLLEKLIDAALDKDTKISKDDAVAVFVGMIDGGRSGLEVVLETYPNHFSHINETLGEDRTLSILNTLGNKVSSEDHLKSLNKLDKLTKDDSNTKLKAELDRAKSKIQKRVDWNKKYLKDINEWFKENEYVPAGSATILMNVSLLGFSFIVTYLFNRN